MYIPKCICFCANERQNFCRICFFLQDNKLEKAKGIFKPKMNVLLQKIFQIAVRFTITLL